MSEGISGSFRHTRGPIVFEFVALGVKMEAMSFGHVCASVPETLTCCWLFIRTEDWLQKSSINFCRAVTARSDCVLGGLPFRKKERNVCSTAQARFGFDHDDEDFIPLSVSLCVCHSGLKNKKNCDIHGQIMIFVKGVGYF